MKKDYTDINIVLDRSGSMESIKSDTIGGFNSFLNEQKKVAGEATITLVQFDDIYEEVYKAIPLSNAPLLNNDTFIPRNTTALLDAIGKTIVQTGNRLAAMSEDNRPEKVIFVILTDGLENASHEYKIEQINRMISHQRDVYKWEFVFLGANQDAIATASQMGISQANALTYAANTIGTQKAFDAVAYNIAAYRANIAPSASFSDEDREEQKKAGA
jgi:hypothetical protein